MSPKEMRNKRLAERMIKNLKRRHIESSTINASRFNIDTLVGEDYCY